MAQGHSADEYLETIYFLAFPIGEYRPQSTGSATLASRVAEMLGVSRASAGEMLKRLEGEGLIERGEQKEAILTETGRARAELQERLCGDPDPDVVRRALVESILHGDRAALVRELDESILGLRPAPIRHVPVTDTRALAG